MNVKFSQDHSKYNICKNSCEASTTKKIIIYIYKFPLMLHLEKMEWNP